MKTHYAAIVLAAGQGKRMNAKVAKQYLLLEGKPVLYYSLKVFQESFVDEIILVTAEDDISYCRKDVVDKYGFHKVTHITGGGAQRYHSVYAGLQKLSGCDYVFIHDGARPFIEDGILKRTCEGAAFHGACAAGMPVKDTIKIADEEAFASLTPPRHLVWMIQTPQVFCYDLIKGAYDKLIKEESMLLQKGVLITDDAMVVEQFTDTKVKLVEGSYENIKITTPEDLVVAALFMKKNGEI